MVKPSIALSVLARLELRLGDCPTTYPVAVNRLLRALVVSEGCLGTAVLGHAQVEAALRRGLAEVPGIEPSYVRLPPLGRPGELLVRHAPVIGRLDLDMQTFRWHAVQSMRAARVVNAAVRRSWVVPDVVHVDGHTIASLLGRVMARIPTFVSLDATVGDWEAMGVWRQRRPWSARALAPSLALERRTLGAAVRVLAWSAWAARSVALACPAARVVEHHPGIDLATFRPPRHRRPGPLRVLFVGGRFEEKGGADLLLAIGPMLGPTLELDVVTPVPLAPRDGMRQHRLMPGEPRLVDLYQQADLFCLPSYGEGLPFALLEAMACGTAAVVSSVGAMPEGVDFGRAGTVVVPGDVARLRAAVEASLADGARRLSIGRAARARCEARYDCRRQARALVEFMHEAV